MAQMTLKTVRRVDVWSLMTLSLQADLVLSDVAATVSHNLFNRCSVILRTDTGIWLKCVHHLKNAIFTQNSVMSATPALNIMRKNLHVENTDKKPLHFNYYGQQFPSR